MVHPLDSVQQGFPQRAGNIPQFLGGFFMGEQGVAFQMCIRDRSSDLVVIAFSIFVFRSIESALYAIIVIFISSQLIDMVVYGGDRGKLVYIFSLRYEDISDGIIKNLGRGVTLLDGEGAYTGQEKQVLMCALRNNEYHKVKKLVHEIDPAAFMIVSDASEVAGEGFKPIDSGR